MYAYCGNNPVNGCDRTGMWWEKVTDFFENVWNGVKTWAKNTFGGEVTTVTTVERSKKIVSEPFPIVVEAGTNTTTTVTQKGNSSKPVSFYAQGNLTSPIKSSLAGVILNLPNYTLDGSIGVDNTGVTGSWVNGNTTNSFGIKMDLSNFKIGFEYSTAIQWDKTTQTNYVNLSASGWWIIAAYIFVTSGQSMPQPTLAY